MFKKHRTSKLMLVSTCALFMAVSLIGCNGSLDPDMSKVVFADQEFTYDGTAKTLEVKNLPSVLNYTFSITGEDGKTLQPSEVVNVGSYDFTANFTAAIENVKTPSPLTAKLTIAKGTYDLSELAFSGLQVAYDGQSHTPTLTGVPAGVTYAVNVFSDNGLELINGGKQAGSYKVVASFLGNENYKPIPDKSAYMVITPVDYQDEGIQITDLSAVYDGQGHLPTVSGLPEGVTASFAVFKADGTTPIAAAVDAGSYKVVISFKGDDNHNQIDNVTVDFTIGKAAYDMSQVVVSDLEQTYTGQAIVPTIKGLPNGVSASFKYYQGTSTEALDNAVAPGTYKAVASFVGDANHDAIADREYQLVIDKTAHDMSNFKIEGLEVSYNGEAHLPTVSGLPEGVTAIVKLYQGNEVVESAINAGEYDVKVSFACPNTSEEIQDRTAKLNILKADYDMSNFEWEDLLRKFDDEEHCPTVKGLPSGVNASIELHKVGKVDDGPHEAVSSNGIYQAIASFTGDTVNHNAIPNETATFIISEGNVTINDVNVYSRTFNVNENANRSIEISGDYSGFKAYVDYYDENGELVENINNAPVGEYDAIVTFANDSIIASNIFYSTLTVTDKVVKNITNYEELVAMAVESQRNFTLLEPTGTDDAGDIDNWDTYNSGNPEDRWANKVTYQLLNDIDCSDNVWKAVGWDITDYLACEQPEGEDYYVIKGTDYKVTVPRWNGMFFSNGYVSLFLDGNGHSIKNLTLNNDTHVNEVGDELGQYPTFLGNFPSYRHTGMFVSTAFSTFKDIVFENPTMTINDTSSTVVWAGFINATESAGNVYQGLEFVNPVINANCKKANIGTISGITLALAPSSVVSDASRVGYYFERPEENYITFVDVNITDTDYTVTTTGGRNSVGGLYGENQSAYLTFILHNVDIDGEITVTGGSPNNMADFFGFIANKYQTRGSSGNGEPGEDVEAIYTFIVNDCQTDIEYTTSGTYNFGTSLNGASYQLAEGVTADTYEPNVYYVIGTSAHFELATGAFDPNQYYFEPVENCEYNTTFIYCNAGVEYAWLLNYKMVQTNSSSTSHIAA